MTALLGDTLLRRVPDTLIAGVNSGEYRVFGSVVRAVSSGQILGHLQETSALHRLGGWLLDGSSLPLKGLDLAGQSVAIIQNEQIKQSLAALQALQVGHLAMGAVGIGVSIAGTAVICKKIDALESQIASLAGALGAIRTGLELLRQDRISDDLGRLRAITEQMNEAWLLENGGAQWETVSRDAHLLGAVFERRVAAIIDAGEQDPAVAEPLMAAIGVASATRVASRLASGATAAASDAAQSGVETMARLTECFSLSTALTIRMDQIAEKVGTPIWASEIKRNESELRLVLSDQRARLTALASSGLTINELSRQGINGRTWLEAARNETDEPLLFLPAITSA